MITPTDSCDDGCGIVDPRDLALPLDDYERKEKELKKRSPFKSFMNTIQELIDKNIINQRQKIRSNVQYLVYLRYYDGETQAKSMSLEEIQKLYEMTFNQKVSATDMWRELNYLVMGKVLKHNQEDGETVYTITVALIDGVEMQILKLKDHQEKEKARMEEEQNERVERFNPSGWKKSI